jgi:hypothetical protein
MTATAPQQTMTEPLAARPTPEQISAVAYNLYLQRGGVDGSALDDWLAAEQLLLIAHADKRMKESKQNGKRRQ